MSPAAYVPNTVIPLYKRDAGGLPLQLECSMGTRVLLIRNVDTDQVLVNGALGQISGFDLTHDMIYLTFDDKTIGQIVHTKGQHGAIAITKITHEYTLNGRHVVSKMYPLVPAWSTTIHKVQGASLTKIVLDLGSSIFEDGMAHVCLSRVTSIDELYIINLNVHTIKPPAKVLEEYSRLRSCL